MKATSEMIQSQEDKDAKRDLKIKELRNVWYDEGNHPVYHREQQKLLKENWGMLHRIIIDLIK